MSIDFFYDFIKSDINFLYNHYLIENKNTKKKKLPDREVSSFISYILESGEIKKNICHWVFFLLWLIAIYKYD